MEAPNQHEPSPIERKPQDDYFERIVISSLWYVNLSLILLFVGYLGQRWVTWSDWRCTLSACLLFGALLLLSFLLLRKDLYPRLGSFCYGLALVSLILLLSTVHAYLGFEQNYSNVILLLIVGVGLVFLETRSCLLLNGWILAVWAGAQTFLPETPTIWSGRLMVAISPLISWLFLQARRSILGNQLAAAERQRRRKRELQWALRAKEQRQECLENLLAERLRQARRAHDQAEQHGRQNLALKELVDKLGEADPLGRLAGGVAHDFCGLLMVFAHNLQELEELIDSDSFAEQAVAEAIVATEEMEALVAALLTYCREQTLHSDVLLVQDLLRDFAAGIGHLFRDRVELLIEAPQAKVYVYGDSRQLSQALLNLCLNALEAMPEGGRLRLRVVLEEPYLKVFIEDTGKGLVTGLDSQIFDPFFSQKPFHQGRGLGLSLVQGIIKKHGGEVWVESTGLGGTSMAFSLPIIKADRTGSIRKVLLLDYDSESALWLEQTLRGHGLAVTKCDNIEALNSHLEPHLAVLVNATLLGLAERNKVLDLSRTRAGLERWVVIDESSGAGSTWLQGHRTLSPPLTPELLLEAVAGE